MTMYAHVLMGFVKHAVDAVDTRGYRDRAELLGVHKGKVVAMEFPTGAIGFYGGGIDPSEDPAAAAAREFYEESGLKVRNVRPSGVGPAMLDWTPEMVADSPKLQERIKQYRGSRTHYFVGDVDNTRREHRTDLDAQASAIHKLRWMPFQKAIDRLRTSKAMDDVPDASGQYSGINGVRAAALVLIAKKYKKQLAKTAEDFATGLPDPKRFGDISQISKDQLLKWVVQQHDAQRAGKHFDVRMGTPQTGLLSWATRKELPEPGGKTMLFQQPVHRYDYAGFQGKIPSGYGAGTVKTHDMGSIKIQEASNGKIKFFTTHKGTPEFYTMVRTTGPRKGPGRTERTQGGSWLLINTTPGKPLQILGPGAQEKMASLVSIIRKRRGFDDSRRPS